MKIEFVPEQIYELHIRAEVNPHDESIERYRCHYCQVATVFSIPELAYDAGYRVIGSYESQLQPVIVCAQCLKGMEQPKGGA